MDDQWHANFKPNFLPRSAESSFNFLFNYSIEPFAGMDPARQAEMMAAGAAGPPQHHHQHHMVGVVGECDAVGGGDPKKKRLTSEQLESLEKSFQEEIKLDPDRKMKLSRDLGLQPRQVAVWFQNRRARWKAKQLERLYDSLKLDFESVSREKHKLQDEVMKLRAMLMEQATRIHNLNTKQVSIGCTEISGGDETVESTSAAGGGRGLSTPHQTPGVSPEQSMAECHYLFSAAPGVDDYNTAASPPPPYWPPLPSSYPC